MSELRFDGRVAIVTGAGGKPALGRAYAELLAARGAKLVVNDLGVGPDGTGARPASAADLAAEIRDAGGEAIANSDSVADEQGAQRIVQVAIDAWGRVDILVNNAGFLVMKTFEDIDSSDLRAIVEVQLLGQIWMCRAVWPHMKRQKYGRIVNTTSRAMLGGRFTPGYDAAKAGINGLTRTLAIHGDGDGIIVNAISPHAGTGALLHMSEDSEWRRRTFEINTPERVAPVIAVLAHDACPVSGKCIWASGGHVAEYYYSLTQGYRDPNITAESLLESFATVTDQRDAVPVPDPIEEDRGRPFVPKSDDAASVGRSQPSEKRGSR